VSTTDAELISYMSDAARLQNDLTHRPGAESGVPVTPPLSTAGQQGDTFPPPTLAADALAPYEGTQGPIPTRNIAHLRPVASIKVDADTVGIHNTGRAMFLSCRLGEEVPPVMLRFPDRLADVDRVVTLLGVAARDGFGGTFDVELIPEPGSLTAWQINGVSYDDGEGVTW
jgi:hypothetical protein